MKTGAMDSGNGVLRATSWAMRSETSAKGLLATSASRRGLLGRRQDGDARPHREAHEADSPRPVSAAQEIIDGATDVLSLEIAGRDPAASGAAVRPQVEEEDGEA